METTSTLDTKVQSIFNRRFITIMVIIIASLVLTVITLTGTFITEEYYAPDFSQKNLPPSLEHIFGTDFMGRDMFFRTIKGLSISMWIGIFATTVSSVMAVGLGFAAGIMGKKVDTVITWFVDLFMSIPHLLLLILLCIAMGKGVFGITVAVIITHWPKLTRIIRAEVMSLRNSQFVKASAKMGKSKTQIVIHHITPHIIPQFIIGLVLLFPHAIMHESAITFLGFGIPAEIPAIGTILSESMNYLVSGMWWLAVFPGLTLLIVVILFELIGDNTRRLIDPLSAQE